MEGTCCLCFATIAGTRVRISRPKGHQALLAVCGEKPWVPLLSLNDERRECCGRQDPLRVTRWPVKPGQLD
jgi:hypothetical protein